VVVTSKKSASPNMESHLRNKKSCLKKVKFILPRKERSFANMLAKLVGGINPAHQGTGTEALK